jgi:uncharacterized membrane protein (DUF106 family)
VNVIVEKIIGLFDWLYQILVGPFFAGIGRGLEWLVLRPLDSLHASIALQIVVVAVLTGLLSLVIRRLLRAEEKDRAFRKIFAAKKAEQQDIDLLPDWKTRDVLYRTTDRDIDEDFNTYLSQRFSRHVAVYLLPIFLALYWLNSVFPADELLRRIGAPYAIPLPANRYGLEGLPVTFVFLAAYVTALFCLFQARKFQRNNGSLTIRGKNKMVSGGRSHG